MKTTLSALALLLGLSLAAAVASPPRARVEGEWGLSAWSSFGQPNLQTIARTVFDKREGRFVPSLQRNQYLLTANPCETLLDNRADFSLKLMLDQGRLSQEQYDFYRGLGNAFHPDQVTFFELTAWLKRESALVQLGVEKLPRQWVADTERAPDGTEWVNLRRASFWSVSAQTLGIKRQKMAFQHEARFSNVKLELADDVFAWEWGRAGQLEPGLIDHMIQVAVLQAYQELSVLGGQLSKARIFIHSVDAVTTRLYETKYPFKREAAFGDDPANCVLSAPLEALFNDPRFQPRKFLGKVADILPYSTRALSDAEAIDFLRELRKLMRAELDYRSPMQTGATHGALTVYDRSDGFLYRAAQLFARYGFFERRQELADYLKTTVVVGQPLAGTPRAEEGPVPEHLFQPRRELQLSGLNVVEAKVNPAYLKSVLVGLRAYYLGQLRAAGNAHYPPELVADQVTYTVFTEDAGVSKELAALGAPAQELSYVKSFRTQTERNAYRLEPEVVAKGFFHSFRASQLEKFRLELGGLNWRPDGLLSDDYWQKRLLLSRPLNP